MSRPDPLYGTDVDPDVGGLFPASEITRGYVDSPATDRAPVTDDGDLVDASDIDDSPSVQGEAPPVMQR